MFSCHVDKDFLSLFLLFFIFLHLYTSYSPLAPHA